MIKEPQQHFFHFYRIPYPFSRFSPTKEGKSSRSKFSSWEKSLGIFISDDGKVQFVCTAVLILGFKKDTLSVKFFEA